jgi:hypothetical protein
MIYQPMSFKIPIDLHQRLKVAVAQAKRQGGKRPTMAGYIVALLEKSLAPKEARNGR